MRKLITFLIGSLVSSVGFAASKYNCELLYHDKAIRQDPLWQQKFDYNSSISSMTKAFEPQLGDEFEAMINHTKEEDSSHSGVIVSIRNKKDGTGAGAFYLPEAFLMNVMYFKHPKQIYVMTCLEKQ